LLGFSKEETARRLGWPVGTVAGRISRGKKLLHSRLIRRGITPALATGMLTVAPVEAALPQLLKQSTIHLAAMTIHDPSRLPTSAVTALTQGVLTSMTITNMKWSVAAIILLAVFTLGGLQALPDHDNTVDIQQPHGSTSTQTDGKTTGISASVLIDTFLTNEAYADDQYTGKTLVVHGKVLRVSRSMYPKNPPSEIGKKNPPSEMGNYDYVLELETTKKDRLNLLFIFTSQDRKQLAALKLGQVVTVTGECGRRIVWAASERNQSDKAYSEVHIKSCKLLSEK